MALIEAAHLARLHRCLSAYVPGEKLRVLPCQHAFHVECIDKWLVGQMPGTSEANRHRLPACPLCKAVPLPNEAPERAAQPMAQPQSSSTREADHFL